MCNTKTDTKSCLVAVSVDWEKQCLDVGSISVPFSCLVFYPTQLSNVGHAQGFYIYKPQANFPKLSTRVKKLLQKKVSHSVLKTWNFFKAQNICH